MLKFAIIYGNQAGVVEMRAVELLSRSLHEYTNAYPVCIKVGQESTVSDCTKIYVGTKSDNEYIRQNSQLSLSHSEEYSITAKDGIIVIEGSDERGVLYGCADFYNKYIVSLEYVDDQTVYHRNPFECKLPDFSFTSYPEVGNRGIWTWGHVIYDYRAFFDNMVRLKLNTVTIWNDSVPVNAREIVDYAHSSGIKILWGYAWFWDTDCSKFDPAAVKNGIGDIIKKYEDEYLPTGCDGIYFQSFTELNSEYIGGVLIADAVTDFVNSASNAFFEKYPDIELHFGLHANSVKEKLEYIKNVNPKVKIIWENCGAFPFHTLPCHTEGFAETLDFAKKIAKLRGDDDSFGVVTKSFVQLNWNSFEHLEAGAFIGSATKLAKARRTEQKRSTWKYAQGYWLANADMCQTAIRVLCEAKDGKLAISALVEDGMFEESVKFPVALYAEILWNPHGDIKQQIREVSLRNYVEFA